MIEFLIGYEPQVRLAAFAFVFMLMALWELTSPRRPHDTSRSTRWPSNLGIVVIDSLAVRVLFPVSAVALAMLCESEGWGLFNNWQLPVWTTVLVSVLILDLVIYWQHVLFHAVPILWRLHRMHHADQEFDVTTGARFHPIEIVLSMIIKLSVVTVLGTPAISVLVFELLLNATAMFNHSNIHMPLGLDRVMRWLVVTPDMHRVHHSVIVRETNSNFGFNLPWWDRLFGTYLDQPADGHVRMVIGLEQFRDPVEQRLDLMLSQPFREPDEVQEKPDTHDRSK